MRVWDKAGGVSAWSQPASWTMGLLREADWQAHWIAARADSETVLLRREFTVKPGLKRAIAHISGLGQYELRVNGRKASDDLLLPGWDLSRISDHRRYSPAPKAQKQLGEVLCH